MRVLLTGGTGYIGSHTAVELINAGHKVVIYDNLSNSNKKVLERLEIITNSETNFVKGDIRDIEKLKSVLISNNCDSVIHFAGLKAVGESVVNPLKYYENNVVGSIYLLNAMRASNIKRIIFSSSATVYGTPDNLPLKEDHKLAPINPYGKTKEIVEKMLLDLNQSEKDWEIGILRYFNPVGAHESGLIGEDPKGIPNNLMPFISQVAVGFRKELNIWGNDFPTKDGTGVRDYIHVVDLAAGHLKMLEKLTKNKISIINLGRGEGYSVIEVLNAFEKVCGKKIPYKIASRRDGDLSILYADPSKALETLDWKAKKNLLKMCEDTWRWQSNNPNGYID